MKLPAYPVAWLLRRANAHPPIWRSEFYALKDALLRRYGRVVGADLQYIRDKCWGYQDGPGCDRHCRRCGGTGIYRERYILLERWAIAGHTFHRPDRVVSREFAHAWTQPFIVGRIEHHGVSGDAALAAGLWLALFFDRHFFWRWLTSSRRMGWNWRPMVVLQQVAFILRCFAGRFRERGCATCDGRFRPLWDEGHWCICRPCRARRVGAMQMDDDEQEIPF